MMVLLLIFVVPDRRRDGDLPRGVRGPRALVQPAARGEHPEPRRGPLDRLRDPRPRVPRPRPRPRARAARGRDDPDAPRAADRHRRGREAIRAVPDSIRQGAYALGATQWQVVSRQVLPAAIPGIATGLDPRPRPRDRRDGAAPARRRADVRGREPEPRSARSRRCPCRSTSGSRGRRRSSGYLAAAGIIVLLAILLTMNAFAIWLRNRYQRRW